MRGSLRTICGIWSIRRDWCCRGCGGEAQEWLDGINDLLTQDGILQNGSRFETVKVFQHDGLNNLLFPFENIQVDMGKLAMWRLQTHGAFGGTWLSDYVPNRLGGFRSARQENPALSALCWGRTATSSI